MERVDNDVGFLAETVEMLAEDGVKLLEQIRAAVAAGDAAAVGRHAHALKGMISNFCAPDTQAVAFEIEKLGKSDDLGPASEAVDLLGQQLEMLTEELTAFVKEKS